MQLHHWLHAHATPSLASRSCNSITGFTLMLLHHRNYACAAPSLTVRVCHSMTDATQMVFEIGSLVSAHTRHAGALAPFVAAQVLQRDNIRSATEQQGQGGDGHLCYHYQRCLGIFANVWLTWLAAAVINIGANIQQQRADERAASCRRDTATDCRCRSICRRRWRVPSHSCCCIRQHP
jgi:hypothetical protein